MAAPHDWMIHQELSTAASSEELGRAIERLEKVRLFSKACQHELEWRQAPTHCYFVLQQQREYSQISEEEFHTKLKQLDRTCHESAPRGVDKLKLLLKSKYLSNNCRQSLEAQLTLGLYKSEGAPFTF